MKFQVKEDEILKNIYGQYSLKEGTSLPDPDYLMRYKELEKRYICILGEIEASESTIALRILRYNIEDCGVPVEDRKPIVIFICSEGGLVDSEEAINGAISASKTPVYTVNIGWACSAAARILASGHKRFAFKNSYTMFHMGYTNMNGTNANVKSAEKFYTSQEKQILSDLYEKTKFTPSIKNRMKNEDIYFNDKESLEYGVVDVIVDDFDTFTKEVWGG